MTQYLAFRGPDSQRTWCNGAVGFGHALLRTATDTRSEDQPASLDGKFWITADARIDARAELIEKLNSKGSAVSLEDPDHQLILQAYRAWGSTCVEHLLGDFAFAIWDSANLRLFCARDHFGVKPFFYARVGGAFIFNNTLNCLRLHPNVSAKLNDRAIADFLLFDFNQDMATTTFADIQRLPPAHTLECKSGSVNVRRYWTLPVPAEVKFKRAEEYVERFNGLLDTAVGDRLRTETAGVLMSGGLDSPIVAASAQRVFTRAGKANSLHAFTDVFDRLIPHEERYYAGLVAKRLGIPIHFRSSDDCTILDVFDNPEFKPPEPANFPWGASTHDQLKEIAAHSRVAFTGLGADPALSSSVTIHFRVLLRKRKFGRAAADMARFVGAEGRFSRLYLRTRWRILFKANKQRSWFPPWLNEDFEKRLNLRDRFEEIERAKVTVDGVRPGAFRLLAGPIWPYIFEYHDSGITQAPIEVCHPFFDLRVLNFLLGLPALPLCSDKELLRRATRGVLPEKVRLRRKSPLLADPMIALLQKPESAWVDVFTPVEGLERYVVRNRIPRVSGETDNWAAWIHLRPLGLNLWLQRCVPLGYKQGVEEYCESRSPKNP
jgi:asparagine synthase (glutamine-hydrolysing)